MYNKGNLTLLDCTITGNLVDFGSGGYGGGLSNVGTATLTDCTLYGNSAKYGGGISNGTGHDVTLTACTISGNSAEFGGGLYNAGKATLTDTIVAGNTKPAGDSNIDSPGTVLGTYNLIGAGGSGGLTNGAGHNIVLTSLSDPGLDYLLFNGGPTETISLLSSSPAIGAGASWCLVSMPTSAVIRWTGPLPTSARFQNQPTVALTANTGSAVFGQAVTLVATLTVLVAPRSGSGTLNFFDDGTALGLGLA